jgi:oxygen-independent coproporphyrinogen III oxidase
VNPKQVRSILEQYIASEDSTFDVANYGVELSVEEQQRRFILISLLSEEGLDTLAYYDRFGTDVLSDYRELRSLIDWQMAEFKETILYLTPLGLERSDAIGPWLFSEAVRSQMFNYTLK